MDELLVHKSLTGSHFEGRLGDSSNRLNTVGGGYRPAAAGVCLSTAAVYSTHARVFALISVGLVASISVAEIDLKFPYKQKHNAS